MRTTLAAVSFGPFSFLLLASVEAKKSGPMP
jgi:hypothetical protein